MTYHRRQRRLVACFSGTLIFLYGTASFGQSPNPVLNTVFPPGGQAGTSFDVSVSGSSLGKVNRLICNHSGVSFKQQNNGKFQATISRTVMPGAYEVRAYSQQGLTSPRTFTVGTHKEHYEAESNDETKNSQPVLMNRVINGRIAKGGDVDQFQFPAKRGQRVIIECQAGRIDSKLRTVLELYNSKGQRLAVNRGYFGIDPVISFRIPAGGTYTVKLFDLVYSGSPDHFYRLCINSGPRVVFAIPSVVELGKTTKVSLFGWNLVKQKLPRLASTKKPDGFDRVEVEITPPKNRAVLPFRKHPLQAAEVGFAYLHPGTNTPLYFGVTQTPIIREHKIHTRVTSQTLKYPCELWGQLTTVAERDWYTIQAKRGEVLWIEAFGQRIGSPVDLDLVILDLTGKVLAHFRDELNNKGGSRFPTNHLDPSGRWVAPADGQYLILIRNLAEGSGPDPRQVYRLNIRREEPGFQLVVVPRRDQPSSLNVPRGGRVIVDVFAFRQRGLKESIRVSAKNLPRGISCPDIWLGPGVNRAPLVISANQNAPVFVGNLQLIGSTKITGSRHVSGSSIVRSGATTITSRLTTGIPFAVTEQAPFRVSANGHEKRNHHLYGKLDVRHSPGSILDVAVQIDRSASAHQSPVKLIGVGLPPLVKNQISSIPVGKSKGYISFYLPPTLPVGTYTIAVQAQTTIAGKNNKGTRTVSVHTNPVTFEVKPAAFVVQSDPFSPKKIRRGEVLQIKYSAKRKNGFINKIHTELYAPEEVIGIRGRGVTFVGQTESGMIQIIANEDAPLGRQPFLRLYAVGVVEDKPVFQGSYFLNLEIVK